MPGDGVLRLLGRGPAPAWRLWMATSGHFERPLFDVVLARLVAEGIVAVEHVPDRKPRYVQVHYRAVYMLATTTGTTMVNTDGTATTTANAMMPMLGTVTTDTMNGTATSPGSGSGSERQP